MPHTTALDLEMGCGTPKAKRWKDPLDHHSWHNRTSPETVHEKSRQIPVALGGIAAVTPPATPAQAQLRHGKRMSSDRWNVEAGR